MTKVTLYIRCLTCWTGAFATIEVERHLPPAVKAPCATCGNVERLMATTGQVVPTLTPAQMRMMHRSQATKTRPEWEQLPLREALMPKESVASYHGTFKDMTIKEPKGTRVATTPRKVP